jgi:hypothetical protein
MQHAGFPDCPRFSFTRNKLGKIAKTQRPCVCIASPSGTKTCRNFERDGQDLPCPYEHSNDERLRFRTYFTGMTTGAFLFFTSKTVNLAGSVWLALRPTM